MIAAKAMDGLPLQAVLRGDAQRLPLPDGSVHAVVTDPPYGLHFMGKAWDTFGTGTGVRALESKARPGSMNAGAYDPRRNAEYGRFMHRVGRELFRVLVPGGHVLMFGAPRRFHWQAVALELAGFEVRDCVAWLFAEGFPKSGNVERFIDMDRCTLPGRHCMHRAERPDDHVCPSTEDGRAWAGWGTALKPGWEPVIVARKPLAGAHGSTVAATLQAHGAGALNIDGGRLDAGAVVLDEPLIIRQGRFPANVALDEGAAALLDAQSGERTSGTKSPHHRRHVPRTGHGGVFNDSAGLDGYPREWPGDSGGASRFFFCAKARRGEREAGLREAGLREAGRQTMGNFPADPGKNGSTTALNDHPTVKPVALMRWLLRLVTPPGGLVLDPFLGSGTTLLAAAEEGIAAIGIEQSAHYCTLANARLAHWQAEVVPTVRAEEAAAQRKAALAESQTSLLAANCNGGNRR